ncbi:Gfo/Idh/MocA family oxidoreductase [Gallibacterium genomosp. 3]|uniref:Oxidoreductase n=1 Tax=Gallibacterium genomosp. 3 TaxID=505345 RepID=A0A1A7PZ22_9PAST|nr:Gfo/Idh/MocA family oxidoreductase [Gallibacterium genomosp. 3]OBX06400.1 oxidoreductase [Gallibacterium genomosp. 3]
MQQVIRVGIAGFGMSANVFHLPFLLNDPRFQVVKIFERTGNKVATKYPQITTVRQFEELLADDVDLVIITTPNLTHYDFTKKAILAGKHIIVEKPLSVTAAEAKELAELAKQHQVKLSVYQNRRWDNGILTVKQLLNSGLLGDIVDYEIHYDRYTQAKNSKAWKETGERGVGLVYDLGVHLIDHVVHLFGMPQALYADLRCQHQGSLGEDNFQIYFYYQDKKVVMSSSKYVREKGPSIAMHGTLGSYVKYEIDNQESLLMAGIVPKGDWNKEDKAFWGTLNTEVNGVHIRTTLETVSGNYQAYYDNIYAALTVDEPLQVTAEQAAKVLDLIEKVYLSAESGRKIML